MHGVHKFEKAHDRVPRKISKAHTVKFFENKWKSFKVYRVFWSLEEETTKRVVIISGNVVSEVQHFNFQVFSILCSKERGLCWGCKKKALSVNCIKLFEYMTFVFRFHGLIWI